IKNTGLKDLELPVFTSDQEHGHKSAENKYFVLPIYEDMHKSVISHLAIANEKGKGSIVSAAKLKTKEVQKNIASLKGEIITYDAKALIKHFWQWDADIKQPFDVHIAGFLLNSLTRDQSLAGLAREWLDLETEAEQLDELDRLRLDMA